MQRLPSYFPRFWNRVYADPDTGCWLWTGAHDPHTGYGKFTLGTGCTSQTAHRLAWELEVGPVEANHEIHHVCPNRNCVRPEPGHLVKVTRREHMRLNGRLDATHCKRGHEFTEENTYIVKATGKRRCRECQRIRDRRRQPRPRRSVTKGR